MMLAVLLLACRVDPGLPDYPEIATYQGGSQAGYEGFQPWEGQARLSFGIFYEGGATETVAIDGVSNHYYIYSLTYSQGPDADRIEGSASDRITVGSQGWWGGGVHWDSEQDLSSWSTLHLGLRATDSTFQDLTVGMTGGEEEVRVRVGDYGFIADGTWQEVNLPLSALAEAGADLTRVTIPLQMIAEGAVADSELLVDDVYLAVEEE